jgi:hypothetical protein
MEDYVSLKAIFTFYIDIGLHEVNIWSSQELLKDWLGS